MAGGSDWLDLHPGVTVDADDRLVASQLVGTVPGSWTPKESAYTVNAAESDPTIGEERIPQQLHRHDRFGAIVLLRQAEGLLGDH